MIYIAFLLSVFLPLNKPIDIGSVIQLPPNVGFDNTQYDYKVIWDHDGNFCLVGQYYGESIQQGFAVYNGTKNVQAGQRMYVNNDLRFVKVGTAYYYRRTVHILCPVYNTDPSNISQILELVIPKAKEYYGGL